MFRDDESEERFVNSAEYANILHNHRVPPHIEAEAQPTLDYRERRRWVLRKQEMYVSEGDDDSTNDSEYAEENDGEESEGHLSIAHLFWRECRLIIALSCVLFVLYIVERVVFGSAWWADMLLVWIGFACGAYAAKLHD